MSQSSIAGLSLLLAALAPHDSAAGVGTSVPLAGEWRLAFDREDAWLADGPAAVRFEDTVHLPGTTAQQRKGPAEAFEPRMDRETFNRLRERHPYVGAAWYQREVAVPADWAGRDFRLTLERVLWESRVWVDGKAVGGPQRSLTVPHRHDLTAALKPGSTHTLTLRIDNREIVPIGSIGHAYTPGTQTLWNGAVGDLTLEALPKERIESVRVVARPDGTLTVRAAGTFAKGRRLTATVRPLGATAVVEAKVADGVAAAPGEAALAGALASPAPWSERSPALYELKTTLLDQFSREVDSRTVTFGFREFRAVGRRLEINGVPTFLRGDLECATFPRTGHPDADGAEWDRIVRVARDYGLNHLRFHSWCPPRAAFEAADRHGVYIQVELPNWTFKMGQEATVDEFLLEEGRGMLREYANHPSLVMLSLGNELAGDLGAMDRLVEKLRAIEPELLYTSTTFAFSPRGKLPGPQDDYFVSQQTESGWVRGQGFLNAVPPSTDTDYLEGMACVEVPLVTHEVGQYVVYPDLSTLPKYDASPVRATAMEAIRDDLKAKGLLADAARFTRDSGKLAALLYKEDIERALRTKGLAGIQLLQLQDFPGQSTATVGLLDAFWDSKGLITPEGFRRFCSPLTPLLRTPKFVWQSDEDFGVDVELANFTEGEVEAGFRAELVGPDGAPVSSAEFPPRRYPLGNGLSVGRFEAPLAGIKAPVRLDLVVRAGTKSADGTAENSWPVWVYPAEEASPEVITHTAADAACLADLAAGRSVLLLPRVGAIRRPIPARFIPVFWSPLHFPNQPGTLGATIDTQHPLWRGFPTDTHTNWQWWELTAQSSAIDLTGCDPTIAKPFRFIDKYDRNALPTAIFETRVGPGKLLVCTLDVTTDPDKRIAARQLGRALRRYVASSEFRPEGSLSPERLRGLVRDHGLSITASNEHPDHPAALALDGNAETLWHTDWRDGEPKLPATLRIDLGGPSRVAGVRLTNRPDGANGRVRDFRLATSPDGERWTDQAPTPALPNAPTPTEARFAAPVEARFVRIRIESSHAAGSHASLAEVEVLPAADDVRDLGLIEGFNEGEK